MDEIFIEAFEPLVSLGRINAHLINKWSLNLYSIGRRGPTIDCDFSLTEKYLFPCFPTIEREKGTWGEAIPPGGRHMVVAPPRGCQATTFVRVFTNITLQATKKYIEKVLERFHMEKVKPIFIPLASHFALSSK